MTEEQKRRLIVVSNRLPFQLLEKNSQVVMKESDGGLVSALKSYFDASNGVDFESMWILQEHNPSKYTRSSSKGKLTTGTTTDSATPHCGHCFITSRRL
jgi:trehalose-6-phosphate synthase